MRGRLLHDLSIEFGLGGNDLARIISTAPARYKTFQIAKRRGGMRTIAQPSRELKEIQRFVLKSVLSKLPVHRAATGYVLGRNIAANALAHSGKRVLLKLDFKDFFPSITVRDWEQYATSRKMEFGPGELAFYNNILFWGQGSARPKCLSIGAPTSPILSNILLYGLDAELSKAAQEARLAYTRYADDITISANTIEGVLQFEETIKSTIEKMKSPRLVFNNEKRGVFTMGQRRMVTGLVLTPTHSISVGRERKRLISAMLHKVALNESNPENMGRLKGFLGFCIANEPDFVSRMRVKYGNTVIDRVLHYEIPRREIPLRRR